MKINVKLHPGSSQERILKKGRNIYEIWIKERAIDGKANRHLGIFLKKELGFRCKVVKGFKSRDKIVEVDEN